MNGTSKDSRSSRRMGRRFGVVAVLVAVFVGSATAAALADKPIIQSGHRLHWGDNEPNYPRGYVYWLDQTGAAFPVYSSAIEWDKAGKLDAVYTTSSGSCPASHCASVLNAPLEAGCSPPYGLTDIPWSGPGHFTTGVRIRIDTQCSSRNAADRRELVCHEMGHSIGIDDRAASSTSCMRTGNMVGRQLPIDDDYDTLRISYSHDS